MSPATISKSRHLLDLPTDLAPVSISPEPFVEFLAPLDATVPCILINVRFTHFQHRTIERSIIGHRFFFESAGSF